MIEIRSTVSMRKPIIPLVDPDSSRGGLTKEEVKEQLVEAEAQYAKWGFEGGPYGEELYAGLFASEPIEWNRLGVFQATIHCMTN